MGAGNSVDRNGNDPNSRRINPTDNPSVKESKPPRFTKSVPSPYTYLFYVCTYFVFLIVYYNVVVAVTWRSGPSEIEAWTTTSIQCFDTVGWVI